MTTADAAALRATLEAQEHEHALGLVGRIRYRLLERQRDRAIGARKDAERRLFDYQLDERDEMLRLRNQVRHLEADNEALRRAVLLATPQGQPAPPVAAHAPNPPAPRHGKPIKRIAPNLLLGSPLVQRLLHGEPAPEPPEPGTYDPTITEDDGVSP